MRTQDMEEELAHRQRERPLGPSDPDRVKAILDAAPDMRDKPPPRHKLDDANGFIDMPSTDD